MASETASAPIVVLGADDGLRTEFSNGEKGMWHCRPRSLCTLVLLDTVTVAKTAGPVHSGAHGGRGLPEARTK